MRDHLNFAFQANLNRAIGYQYFSFAHLAFGLFNFV